MEDGPDEEETFVVPAIMDLARLFWASGEDREMDITSYPSFVRYLHTCVPTHPFLIRNQVMESRVVVVA